MDEELKTRLKDVGDDVNDDTGWAHWGDVGNHLLLRKPDFDSRNYGFAKLSSLVKSYNALVDFQTGIDQCDAATLREYEGRLDEVPHIFGKMQPTAGAVEAFAELAERYATYILSTAPWNNHTAWSDKLNWVKTHLCDGAYKRLILTHHKKLAKGDYLIDDRTKNGASNFEGELILFGSECFPAWEDVLKYLRNSH